MASAKNVKPHHPLHPEQFYIVVSHFGHLPKILFQQQISWLKKKKKFENHYYRWINLMNSYRELQQGLKENEESSFLQLSLIRALLKAKVRP